MKWTENRLKQIINIASIFLKPTPRVWSADQPNPYPQLTKKKLTQYGIIQPPPRSPPKSSHRDTPPHPNTISNNKALSKPPPCPNAHKFPNYEPMNPNATLIGTHLFWNWKLPEENKWLVPDNQMDGKQAATNNHRFVSLPQTHTPGMTSWSTQSLSSITKIKHFLEMELFSTPPSLPQLSHGTPPPNSRNPLKQQGAIPAASISKCTQTSQLQANESKSHINWHSSLLKLIIIRGK